MEKVLEGIKVLDLTRVLAGPFCTMMLGDLGALVLKVETPEKGDDFRSIGPFIKGESIGFMNLNRNKKSLTLNLQSEKGKDIFKKLIPQFDVVVENFRPGVMKKLGLEYNLLKEINPQLIYACVSGFGQDGPYAFKSAYDFIISGYSGIMSLCAHPGGEPIRIGIGMVDIVAGLFTAFGILSALRARDKYGKGQMVDISMLDCIVSLMENPIGRYLATGEIPKPPGNQHPFLAPMGVYPTKDEYIIIAVGNQNLWNIFCKAIGREDLSSNPRFSSNTNRIANLADLRSTLAGTLQTKGLKEWLEVLDKAGIPCGPLNTIDKVISDPQVLHRNMIQELNHPISGKIQFCGIPVKISGFTDNIEVPSPILGEHNSMVLRELLGLSEQEINELKKEQII